jgi:hypothetical protein
MSIFVSLRGLACFVAPLCNVIRERAAASELGQDKRDSLRRSWAVVLVLRVNLFAQAAHSRRSLSVSAKHCTDVSIFTSRASCHVS